MKKVSILLVFTIVLSLFSGFYVSAEEENYKALFYEDYDTIKEYGYAPALTSKIGGERITLEDKSGAYRLSSVETGINYLSCYLYKYETSYGDLFIQFDMKMEELNTPFYVHMYNYYKLRSFYVDASGKVKYDNCNSENLVDTGVSLNNTKWYRIAIHFKQSIDKYDIYIDGEVVAKDIEVLTTKGDKVPLDEVKRVNFTLSSSPDSSVLIDNIVMYESDTYKSEFKRTDILSFDKHYYDYEDNNLDEFLKDKKVIFKDTLDVVDKGVIKKGGITLTEVEDILNGNHSYKYMYYDEYVETITLSDTEISESDYSRDFRLKIRSRVTYNRLSSDEIKSNLKASHPRLMLNDTKIEEIKKSVIDDEYTKKAFSKHKRANKNWDSETQSYIASNIYTPQYIKSSGSDAVSGASTIEGELINLAFSYAVEGDEFALETLEKNLNILSEFPDWGGSYFSTCYIATGVALAYDWAYNGLSSETKKKVEKALYNNVLLYYAPFYQGIMGNSGDQFLEHNGNTNSIVNLAIILSALDLYDVAEYTDIAQFMFNTSTRSLENSFEYYITNEGAIPESVSYIGMCIESLCIIMDSLSTAISIDTNFSKTRHLDRTAQFLMGVTGPMGYNDFHDTTSVQEIVWEKPQMFSMPYILFLGKTYDESIAGAYKYLSLYNDISLSNVYEVIWGAKEYPKEELECDSVFYGMLNMAFFRNSYYDSNDLYLSIHAGNNYVSHSHNDGGTFVFQALGKEWFCDLGSENYASAQSRDKMNSYRLRAEGHNVYIINPRADSTSISPSNPSDERIYSGQALNGYAGIIDYSSTKKSGHIVYDMSDLYRQDVKSAKRGARLTENRTAMVLRDEINLLKENSEVLSFLHTTADIEIINDELAILTKDNEKLAVLLSTNVEGAKLKVMEAKSVLPDFVTLENAYSNDMYRKLAVSLTGSGEIYINLDIIPLYTDETEIIRHNDPISTWEKEDGELTFPELTNLYYNGVKKDVDLRNRMVKIDLDEGETAPGILTVDAPQNIDVEIKNVSDLGDTAKIILTDKETKVQLVYTIYYYPALSIVSKIDKALIEDMKSKIETITYEGEEKSGEINIKERLTDDNMSTYFDWYKYNGELIVTLDKTRIVDKIYTFFAGGARRYLYDIGFSTDGVNYSYIRNINQSIHAGDYDVRTFKPRPAKYIKFILNGNPYTNTHRSCPGELFISTADTGDYTLIGTYEEFDEIRNNPSGNYYLVSDITLPDSYVPIPDFSGKLIGYDIIKGERTKRTITANINLPDSENVGVFARIIGNDAEVSHIITDGTITGKNLVGGLVGTAATTDYTSIITNCENRADVTGVMCVGGIIGNAFSDLIGLTATYLTNSGNIVATREISHADVGGIVGVSGKPITYKYLRNSGTVSSEKGISVGGIIGRSYTSIYNAYNTGKISGPSKVGGIVGNMAQDSRGVVNSFNYGEVSGTSLSGAIIGSINKDDLTNIRIINCYNAGIIKNNDVLSTSILGNHPLITVDEGSDSYYIDTMVTDTLENTYGLSAIKMQNLDSFKGFSKDDWTVSKDSIYHYPLLKWGNEEADELIINSLGHLNKSEVTESYSPVHLSVASGSQDTDFKVNTISGYETIKKGTDYIAVVCETVKFKNYKLEEQGIEINGIKYKSNYTTGGKYIIILRYIKDITYKPYSIYSFQGKTTCVYGREKSI